MIKPECIPKEGDKPREPQERRSERPHPGSSVVSALAQSELEPWCSLMDGKDGVQLLQPRYLDPEPKPQEDNVKHREVTLPVEMGQKVLTKPITSKIELSMRTRENPLFPRSEKKKKVQV